MVLNFKLFGLSTALMRWDASWALLALAVHAVVAHSAKAESVWLGAPQARVAGSGVNPLKCQPFVVLYRMDRAGNGDGILDPDEIPDGAESFVQRLVSESKVTMTRSTPLKRVAIAWHRKAPRTTDRVLKSHVIQRAPSRSAHRESAASHRDCAANFLGLYDENANGLLEPREWSRIGGDWYGEDTDLNGVLSLEELSRRFMAYEQVAADSEMDATPSDSISTATIGPHPSAHSQDKPEARELSRRRRSYRRRTPHERLPAGIPDWYIQKDADLDGQIIMAEFAKAWDDEKLAAFHRYDRNGDGVVTPSECLTAEAQQRPGLGRGK